TNGGRYWCNKFGRAATIINSGMLAAYIGVILSVSLTPRRARYMHVFRWLAIVVVTGLLGCLLGALIGYSLGTQFPGYYSGVFSMGNEPWFDPTQVGVGLGVS